MRWVLVNKSRINMDHVRSFYWSGGCLHIQFLDTVGSRDWQDPDRKYYYRMCWSQGIRPDGWAILELLPPRVASCMDDIAYAGKQVLTDVFERLAKWITWEDEEEDTSMDKLELKPCPFCGDGVEDTILDVSKMPSGNWVITHFCDHSPSDLGVCISVYGKSKKEAVDKWNRRVREIRNR